MKAYWGSTVRAVSTRSMAGAVFGRWAAGVALAAAIGLPALAADRMTTPMPPPGTPSVRGIGGGVTPGSGGAIGRDSIGGLVRPGDSGSRAVNTGGSTGGGAGGYIAGARAPSSGPGPLNPRDAGGQSGSSEAQPRSGDKGAGAVQDDLGIHDPFAAVGTGIGGPAPDDMGARSVNDALSQLPVSGGGLAGTGPAGGALDMNAPGGLNPLGDMTDDMGLGGPAAGMGAGGMGMGGTGMGGTGAAGAYGGAANPGAPY